MGLDLQGNVAAIGIVRDGKPIGARVIQDKITDIEHRKNRSLAKSLRKTIRRKKSRRSRAVKCLQSVGMSFKTLPPRKNESLIAEGLFGPLSSSDAATGVLHLVKKRGWVSSNGKGDGERYRLDKKVKSEAANDGLQYPSQRRLAYGKDACHYTRSDRREELQKFLSVQEQYHPSLKFIHDDIMSLFDEMMPKKAPRAGRCPVSGEIRAPKSHPVFEAFRAITYVNKHLVWEDGNGKEYSLTPEQVVKFKNLLSHHPTVLVSSLKKKMGMPGNGRFRFEKQVEKNGKKEWSPKSLAGSPFTVKLSKAVPEWSSWSNDQIFGFADEMFKQSDVVSWCCSRGYSEDVTSVIVDVASAPGRASFSSSTMVTILPHVESGMDINNAVKYCYNTKYEDFLSVDEMISAIPSPEVRRMVKMVIPEVQRVVREYDVDDVYVEYARVMAMTDKQRARYEKRQRENKWKRDRAKEFLEKNDYRVTGNNITKYLLWQECWVSDDVFESPYDGRMMKAEDVFSRTENAVDVEHILPKNRSLDDSMANKTLCFRSLNLEKGSRTPYEMWGETSRMGEIKKRLKRMPRFPSYKAKRILEDWREDPMAIAARELNNTAYIARVARKVLQKALPGVSVHAVRANHLARVRNHWGANRLLGQANDKKCREDSRHHMIDAVVLAAFDSKMAYGLGNENSLAGFYNPPLPHPDFVNSLRSLLDGVIVSHKEKTKPSGSLYKDTVYRRTGKGHYEVRKPIGSITLDDLKYLLESESHREIGIAIKERMVEFGFDFKNGSSADFEALKRRGRKAADGSISRPFSKDRPVIFGSMPVKTYPSRCSTSDIFMKKVNHSGGSVYRKSGGNHEVNIFRIPEGTLAASYIDNEGSCREAHDPKAKKIRISRERARGWDWICSLRRGTMVQFTEDVKGRNLKGKVYWISGISRDGELALQRHDWAAGKVVKADVERRNMQIRDVSDRYVRLRLKGGFMRRSCLPFVGCPAVVG